MPEASPERERLERIAANSLYAAGINRDTIVYSFRIFARHFRGTTVLEMGPAEGVMTELLVATGMDVTAVEGSERFCESLRSRFPRVDVVHSLFESYRPDRNFDNIVLGHVLEHVDDPVSILAHAADWLAQDGRIFAAVPNSHSIHRQAAVLMGLLRREDELNETDLHHGHRRVFNQESLRDCFVRASLRIESSGGYWLKPLSNRQIEASWTPQMLEAFMMLGENYPDIAGEIYVIAGK